MSVNNLIARLMLPESQDFFVSITPDLFDENALLKTYYMTARNQPSMPARIGTLPNIGFTRGAIGIEFNPEQSNIEHAPVNVTEEYMRKILTILINETIYDIY